MFGLKHIHPKPLNIDTERMIYSFVRIKTNCLIVFLIRRRFSISLCGVLDNARKKYLRCSINSSSDILEN